MLYSCKNRENLENLTELVSLNKKVYEIRLHDKLGKQNLHENRKNYMNQLLIQLKIHLEIYQKL